MAVGRNAPPFFPPGLSTRSQTPLLERLAKRVPEPFIIPLSGGIAGAVSGIVSCPLDVIKTKLQAQGGFRHSQTSRLELTSHAYRGVVGSAATIWREDGLRGMYRGIGPMLLGYVPTWAVYLTVYNKTQTLLRRHTANICASICGGACSTLATNPIWVIKTRLMSQSSHHHMERSSPPWHYKNTWDAARRMYRSEGIMSFYSGLTPALLGLTHVAIQFPLYELFKEKFTGITKGQKESDEDRSHHFYGLALAVLLSKVCASTATYPHEVLRTRLQTQQRSPSALPSTSHTAPHVTVAHPINTHTLPHRGVVAGTATPQAPHLAYRGTWQTCTTIFAEEGWRGFYAGLGTNLIRAVPSAMTTILTFEYLKKTMLDLHARAEGEPV